LEEWIECNISLENAPWDLVGQEWLDWFEVDTGCEDKDYEVHHKASPQDIYDLITEVVPLYEETEKLKGVESILDAISAGWRYGLEENVENGAQGHQFLHAFFSLLSYINLSWGVGLHREYNRFAIQHDKEPCARKKKKKRRRAPRSRTQGNRSIRLYADMIGDPCGATLVPGINGTEEGILARLKTTTAISSTDYGMVLWCPTYFGSDGQGQHGNIFLFRDATGGSSINVTNTQAVPLGVGASFDPAGNLSAGGANAFCESATVADARVVSACLRMRYLGKMVDVSGEIAFVENLSTQAFLEGSAGLPVSVDDLFNMSTKITRLGLESNEVVYRPDPELAGFFKTTRDGAITEGTVGASASVITSEALRFGPTWIGFVWRGCTAADLTFDFIQNIEWRPEVNVGYVAIPPKAINDSSMIGKATKWLDSNYPGWSVTLGNVARRGANAVARSVFSYGANFLTGSPVAANMITY
jgi:hypothetical protein